MELNLSRQPLFINEVVIDQTLEQPVECDALLPDYCPDIVRILKCVVTPSVMSQKVSAGRLEVEGMAAITVYYASTAESIAKAEYKVPFARMMELKGEPVGLIVAVQASADYVNCRAVNQRRLDIRGAVSLMVKVTSCKEEQVISGGTGLGLQLKKESITGTRILARSNKETRMSEVLDLAYGKPSIQSILRARAVPRVLESKTAGGKVVLKGELVVHLLYRTAAGGWDQMEYTLPTNTVVEADGIDDACRCDAQQEVLSLSTEATPDANGEYRCVNLDLALLSTVQVYQDYETTVCTDCYSTRNQCSFRTKALNKTKLGALVQDAFTHKENITLPENVEEIVDMWCDVVSTSGKIDAGNAVMEARLCVSMFAKMNDGEIYYFDKYLETEHKLPVDAPVSIYEPFLTCTGSGYMFTANDIVEVRCELQLSGTVSAQEKLMLVEEITVDEKKPKTDLQPAGLYIYRTSGGDESLWDIAKRYNTNIDKIVEENPEDPEHPDQRNILLIPVLK